MADTETSGASGGERARREEFSVDGDRLVSEVKRIIREGNARRIIIKHEGRTLLEIPLTLGAVGAVFAPVLAAVGATAALVAKCTIVVEKADEPGEGEPPPQT